MRTFTNPKLIVSAVQKAAGYERAITAAIDEFIASGFISTDLISPKSKGSTISPDEFSMLNETIVAGFSAPVRKLMSVPVKSLSDNEKSERRYWQQQIGARRNDFKRQLEKRESAGDSDTVTTPKTNKTKILEALSKAIAICEKDEAPDYNAAGTKKSLNEVIKSL
jgi:hypothetical protein